MGVAHQLAARVALARFNGWDLQVFRIEGEGISGWVRDKH